MHQGQVGLEALLTRDLQAFFAALDLTKPEQARDALLEFLPAIIREYGLAGAAAAADWYDELRASLGLRDRFRARSASIPPDMDARVEATVRRSAGYLFVEGSAALALPSMLDPATKYVLEPPRLTIVQSTAADPRARGWERVARPGACDFCVLLTKRGAVYTEATAKFESHGHCHCVSAPVWS